MPELPEVETTCRGIAPLITGKVLTNAIVRNRNLRWPITAGLKNKLVGQVIRNVWRRGKYLLLTFDQGSLIIHLGMSGHLAVVENKHPPGKHDHLDLCLDNDTVLRFHDPRRFGAVLWTTKDPLKHKLLNSLGPEPLGAEFTAEYLFDKTRKHRRVIRDALLDGHLVAGIGNIYANEALFKSGIDPRRAAGRISKIRYHRLIDAIKLVLTNSIKAGGTTLRDFRGGDGRPGYFQQQLKIYGRVGEKCPNCTKIIRSELRGGRTLYYCPGCQR